MTVAYHSVQIPAAGAELEADIVVPPRPHGIVLFAHGSGSSRFSPRNRYVAEQLQHAGLATALADLLTPAEEQADARTGELRFDIGLLAARLAALTDWLTGQEPAGAYLRHTLAGYGDTTRWFSTFATPGAAAAAALAVLASVNECTCPKSLAV